MTDWEAFFTVHRGLPREGPGEEDDVAWALSLAALPRSAWICDAGAGPGADVSALLAAPDAHVLALEAHESFVAQMQVRFADESGVTVEQGDMRTLPQHRLAPFDMIWCAGALYFLGLQTGLEVMRAALKPGAVLAFSEPAFFTPAPSTAAVSFWQGHDTKSESQIAEAVAATGFAHLGQRRLRDAAWEAYYGPMEERIAALRPSADARLLDMLEQCAAEAAQWRSVRAETGYLLTVARLL